MSDDNGDLKPDAWLCAALPDAFKLLGIKHVDHGTTNAFTIVRVLHKESGAVWSFECHVERDPVR